MGTDSDGKQSLWDSRLNKDSNIDVSSLSSEEKLLIAEHRKMNQSKSGSLNNSMSEQTVKDKSNESTKEIEKRKENTDCIFEGDSLNKNKDGRKKNMLLQDASATMLVDAVALQATEVDADVVGLIVGNLRKEGENATLTDVFGKLKDSLRCKHCNGRLKKCPGKQTERLKCDKDGNIEKYDLAFQLPKEILKAYFEVISSDERKKWVEMINSERNIPDSTDEDIEGLFGKNTVNTKHNEISTKEQAQKVNEKEGMEEEVKKSVKHSIPKDPKELLESVKSNGEIREMILFPAEEFKDLDIQKLSTLQQLAIGKSTKEIIWHLLNAYGKIAEDLKINNYSKKEKTIKIDNEKTEKKIENEKTEKKIENEKTDQIRKNDQIQKLEKLHDNNGNKPVSYADAINSTIKTKSELTSEEIRQACAFTFNPIKIEPYTTIHFRGMRKCQPHVVYRIFSALGVKKEN